MSHLAKARGLPWHRVRVFLAKPFSGAGVRCLAFCLSAGVAPLPLITATAINARVESPVLFFASLVAYGLMFAGGVGRFERWRVRHLIGVEVAPPARRRFWRTAAYAALNAIVGSATLLLAAGWIVMLVRNLVLYPLPGIGEWGHPYPDSSWGGPTWQGAVALHAGGAVASLFVFPWVMQAMAGLQTRMIATLLGTNERE